MFGFSRLIGCLRFCLFFGVIYVRGGEAVWGGWLFESALLLKYQFSNLSWVLTLLSLAFMLPDRQKHAADGGTDAAARQRSTDGTART